ncbi:MAG: type II toxin-antitoxin system HicA family toxin [Deltaproteobacteria bacterium]
MNTKQKKTLAMIFEKPTRSDISWQETVSLLLAIGAIKKDGKGSRVRFRCRDYSLHVHAPHPGKVIAKGAAETIRGFLTDIGVAP